MTLHNVIMLIKSILNKDKNHYYCKIFVEKWSCQLTKKKSHFFDSIIMLRIGETKTSKEKFSAAKK